jgi:hypothetical protein
MGKDISTHIQESSIRWDPIKQQVAISAKNVDILDNTNEPLATIPEVSFEFNIFRLLLGSFLSSEITIVKPTLYLTTNHKQLYVRSKKDQANPINVLEALHHYLNKDTETFNINRINLQEASIYIDNGQTNSLWTIKGGFIQVNKKFLRNLRTVCSHPYNGRST